MVAKAQNHLAAPCKSRAGEEDLRVRFGSHYLSHTTSLDWTRKSLESPRFLVVVAASRASLKPSNEDHRKATGYAAWSTRPF